MPKRDHQPVDARREQLVDAAIAVIRDDGVAGATTRAITGRAGLPHGAFHYCFGSKAGLYRALLERELGRTLERVDLALDEQVDAVGAASAALKAQFDLVRQDPDYQRAMDELTVTAARTPELKELVMWEKKEYQLRIANALATWSEAAGVTWQVDANALAAVLIAVSMGVTNAWLTDGNDVKAERTLAIAAQSLRSFLSDAPDNERERTKPSE